MCIFLKEYDRLRKVFQRLDYPVQLIERSISHFIVSMTTDRTQTPTQEQAKKFPIIIPFKDQKSANSVRRQLKELSAKIRYNIQPVFTSKKLESVLKPKENKPPVVNQQSVVYRFECGLCDASYVGFTRRHLHQRIEEHKRTNIGRHVNGHNLDIKDLSKYFKILKRCTTKLDCLIYKILYIKCKNPSLNIQSDSIKAKLFP